MFINFNTLIFEALKGYVTKMGLPSSPHVPVHLKQLKKQLNWVSVHFIFENLTKICQNFPIVVEIGQHTAYSNICALLEGSQA